LDLSLSGWISGNALTSHRCDQSSMASVCEMIMWSPSQFPLSTPVSSHTKSTRMRYIGAKYNDSLLYKLYQLCLYCCKNE